jgi:hypothetical protein
MPEKKFKQVCKCEHCGNEAEMIITCTLEPEEEEVMEASAEHKAEDQPVPHKTRGHAVCTHCGNEADMWVDLK